MTTIQQPKIGDRFESSDSKIFIVTGLKDMNRDLWVEYTDQEQKRDYYCRLEAFLARFRRTVNA